MDRYLCLGAGVLCAVLGFLTPAQAQLVIDVHERSSWGSNPARPDRVCWASAADEADPDTPQADWYNYIVGTDPETGLKLALCPSAPEWQQDCQVYVWGPSYTALQGGASLPASWFQVPRSADTAIQQCGSDEPGKKRIQYWMPNCGNGPYGEGRAVGYVCAIRSTAIRRNEPRPPGANYAYSACSGVSEFCQADAQCFRMDYTGPVECTYAARECLGPPCGELGNAVGAGSAGFGSNIQSYLDTVCGGVSCFNEDPDAEEGGVLTPECSATGATKGLGCYPSANQPPNPCLDNDSNGWCDPARSPGDGALDGQVPSMPKPPCIDSSGDGFCDSLGPSDPDFPGYDPIDGGGGGGGDPGDGGGDCVLGIFCDGGEVGGPEAPPIGWDAVAFVFPSFSEDPWLASGCPAPASINMGQFGQHGISFQPVCDQAPLIRTVLLILSYMTALGIIFGARSV